MNEIKTLEERENSLITKGKEKGFITYEELAEELKGLEIDSDALDNLYNKLVENKIEVSCSTEGSHIFSVQYEPKERLIQNDLASFLTERYCIWNVHRNRIIKIPIRHKHWNLSNVDVNLHQNELFTFKNYFSNFIMHYSPYKHTMLYPFESYGLLT